jgi:hypothetical protein
MFDDEDESVENMDEEKRSEKNKNDSINDLRDRRSR